MRSCCSTRNPFKTNERRNPFAARQLYLEHLQFAPRAVQAERIPESHPTGDKPVAQAFKEMTPQQRDLFASTEGYLMSLGDDVQRKDLKLYVVYKRMRNFCCVIVQKRKFTLQVSLNPDDVDIVEGFTRDTRGIGHWGTGDLEITLRTLADLDRAKPLLRRAYEGV